MDSGRGSARRAQSGREEMPFTGRLRPSHVQAAATEVGLWEWNAATEEFWAAAPTRRILGFDSQAPLTLDALLRAIHLADHAEVLQALRAAPADEVGMRVRLWDAAHESSWVAVQARASRGAHGALEKVTGCLIDERGRERPDVDLQGQRSQLTHLTRVAVLGELSEALVHELPAAPLHHVQCAGRPAPDRETGR